MGHDEVLTRSQIAKMPYLKCVLNDGKHPSVIDCPCPPDHVLSASRLYPQLPINVRMAVRTTLIPSGGGPDRQSPVLIRKGTGVGYSVYHMHRLKELYGEDASEFRPERWENGKLDKIGWGFMPFHGGPRICLGSK